MLTVRFKNQLRCLCFWFALALSLTACKPSPKVTSDTVEIALPAATKATTAVIFLHGILGNARETFTDADSGTYWPQLLATDPKLSGPVHVWSFGYDSTALEKTSNIGEIATRLLSFVQDKLPQYEQVIFITHSMGGLITKRVLLQLQQDDIKSLRRVAGVFFLGVPAGGSKEADYAQWISNNPQFRDLSSTEFNSFLQLLEDDWVKLLQRRGEIKLPLKTFCIYETKPLGTSVVVPRSTAQMGCDDRPIAFDKNHANLVKPSSRSDPVFNYVQSRVHKLMALAYLQTSADIKLLNRQGVPFPADVSLRSGEQYAIQIQANKPSWMYVFAQDSSGEIVRYFPLKTSAQVQPLHELRIPTQENIMIELDNQVGVEKIALILSENQLPKLTNAYREMGATAKSIPNREADALLKKGGMLAQAKPQKLGLNMPSIETIKTEKETLIIRTFSHLPN